MSRYKNNITLPDIYDCQLEEKKIIKFWHKQKTFEKIRNSRRTKNDGQISFYSGPVFPTGYPHAGNYLNGIVKDVFTRYCHQKNLQVNSRFGWDCHGLPVEHEVDKKLEIKSPKDVHEIGIPTYNEECCNTVHRNISDWKNVFERTGNLVDLNEQYSTMTTEYMESVWGVFKELFDKGLVYKDTKVLPYSTACFTHLSNFEAEQNCKEVTEAGMNISVDIVDSAEKLLIWTTTPWTLISNSAICVNPKAIYVKVKVNQTNKDDVVYILSKNRLPFVFTNISEYTVLEELPGASLQDLIYVPLFENMLMCRDFRILLDDSVSDEVGTGMIPLDDIITQSLKERGHVYSVADIKYKKPFCWRSDTPLINKKVSSWFIRVETLAEKLLENNSQVDWISDGTIKEKYFTEWLEKHLADWAISRTRYWGTPIPIWSSPSGDEVVCVGGIEELKQLTGKMNIDNLHRECVDWFVIPSRTPGNPPLRRVPEVFDCWFESGVLPFAHRQDETDQEYQVDFVAECIDQTRGWFYTTLLLSAALSQLPPYRKVFATGLVLESDGSKVCKRKHNHNDSMRLIEKYGADAFRLYILSSPLVKCEGFAIQEQGVADMAEAVIKRIFRVFSQCTSQLGCPRWISYGYITEWYIKEQNVIDQWILSRTESLLKFYHEEMTAFRLHNIVPKIIELLQQIEDWYIPIRPAPPLEAAEHRSSTILFNIIYKLCLMLAPFAPFITEYFYQIHCQYIGWYCRRESIHEALLLNPLQKLLSPDIDLMVSRMQTVVTLVRALRARHIVPNQYPIKEVIVIHHSDGYLRDIEMMAEFIKKLINCQDIRRSKDCHEFEATLKAELKTDSPLSRNQRITSAIHALSGADTDLLIQEGSILILGQTIPLDDIQISYQIDKELESNYSVTTTGDLIVVMKMNKSLLFYEEGTVKEISNRIRNLKKKRNYYPSDRPIIYYSTKEECLRNMMAKHSEHLNKTTNSELKLNENSTTPKNNGANRIEEAIDIKGLQMKLQLCINCD